MRPLALRIAGTLVLSGLLPPLIAGEPAATARPGRVDPGLIKRMGEINDAVLAHHVDPPASQQMVLSGIKGVYAAADVPMPAGLGKRVSALATPGQFAGLLDDCWPSHPKATVTPKQLEDAFLEGMLASVSGQTSLLSAKELRIQEQLDGNRYVGIHISVRYDEKEKRTVIQTLIPGGPAQRAGMKEEDRIEAIDGVTTDGLKIAQVVDRLRGPVGTEVTVTVRQPKAKEARPLKMTRETLFLPTVAGYKKSSSGEAEYLLPGPEKVAYLRVESIGASTPHELRAAARKIEDAGAKGLVLDLRGAMSALLHSTVLLADCLLESGKIGRVRSAERVTDYDATADSVLRGLPIVVLVDAGTACGGEMLAAALQDNHRAVLVGTPTASTFFGLARGGPATNTGEVKTMIPLGDGAWSLMMATGRLERGDGRPICVAPSRDEQIRLQEQGASKDEKEGDGVLRSRNGVRPDHLLSPKETGHGPWGRQRNAFSKDPEQPVDPAKDPYVKKALEVLQQPAPKA